MTSIPLVGDVVQDTPKAQVSTFSSGRADVMDDVLEDQWLCQG